MEVKDDTTSKYSTCNDPHELNDYIYSQLSSNKRSGPYGLILTVRYFYTLMALYHYHKTITNINSSALFFISRYIGPSVHTMPPVNGKKRSLIIVSSLCAKSLIATLSKNSLYQQNQLSRVCGMSNTWSPPSSFQSWCETCFTLNVQRCHKKRTVQS